ncbi:MAG: cytochrome c [Verrucomicrobia bacterium]|nr:MAG: cytochrome c [Verrucomicrobiota bacterium]
MDPSRDNPFLRFATYWWGLGTLLIFAVLVAVVWLFNRSEPTSLEDAAAVPRYETRKKIEAAQVASLSQEEIQKAIPAAAAALLASKPVAIEKPEQIVPGSATAKKIAEAPAVDTTAMDAAPAADEPIDPAVMELGKASYMICSACHGMEGQGGIGPPLAGSEWVAGPISNLIKIQLRGLVGGITVKGVEYNIPGGMAALAYQTDDQVAAVLTYVRNSFGNKASAVKPDQVAALRSEVGKPQVKREELVKP